MYSWGSKSIANSAIMPKCHNIILIKVYDPDIILLNIFTT